MQSYAEVGLKKILSEFYTGQLWHSGSIQPFGNLSNNLTG